MMTPMMIPMMVPGEKLASTANSGGGGGATLATVGGVRTASTLIEKPVTFANMAVALLGLLIALAIVDCTEAAVAVGVRMRTLTMTLPADMVNSTAEGSTPARAATALLIWDCTLEVNEETSPSSRRVNTTTLIAALALCSLQVLRASIPAIVAFNASCIPAPGCILEICWVMTAPHQTENPASVHVEAHPMHPLSRR